MGLPWSFCGIPSSYGTPVEIPRDFHGTFMKLMWFSMVFPCCLHGKKVSSWVFHGTSMGQPRQFHIIIWEFHGTSMGFPWEPHGTLMGPTHIKLQNMHIRAVMVPFHSSWICGFFSQALFYGNPLRLINPHESTMQTTANQHDPSMKVTTSNLPLNHRIYD